MVQLSRRNCSALARYIASIFATAFCTIALLSSVMSIESSLSIDWNMLTTLSPPCVPRTERTFTHRSTLPTCRSRPETWSCTNGNAPPVADGNPSIKKRRAPRADWDATLWITLKLVSRGIERRAAIDSAITRPATVSHSISLRKSSAALIRTSPNCLASAMQRSRVDSLRGATSAIISTMNGPRSSVMTSSSASCGSHSIERTFMPISWRPDLSASTFLRSFAASSWPSSPSPSSFASSSPSSEPELDDVRRGSRCTATLTYGFSLASVGRSSSQFMSNTPRPVHD
mmetsp:Transcript_17044/g.48661  ORF Transcript_17044/g.48661 Transcript_17044/m.48661 type:complete len:287 (-) Transcript_17044:1008-1868(-)